MGHVAYLADTQLFYQLLLIWACFQTIPLDVHLLSSTHRHLLCPLSHPSCHLCPTRHLIFSLSLPNIHTHEKNTPHVSLVCPMNVWTMWLWCRWFSRGDKEQRGCSVVCHGQWMYTHTELSYGIKTFPCVCVCVWGTRVWTYGTCHGLCTAGSEMSRIPSKNSVKYLWLSLELSWHGHSTDIKSDDKYQHVLHTHVCTHGPLYHVIHLLNSQNNRFLSGLKRWFNL